MAKCGGNQNNRSPGSWKILAAELLPLGRQRQQVGAGQGLIGAQG